MKTLTTLLMLLFIFPTISFSQDVEDGAVTKKKKEKQLYDFGDAKETQIELEVI